MIIKYILNIYLEFQCLSLKILHIYYGNFTLLRWWQSCNLEGVYIGTQLKQNHNFQDTNFA